MEPVSSERLEAIIATSASARDGNTVRFPTLDESSAIASELLNLRRRDEDLGFSYDHRTNVLDLLGTKFSRVVLEHFRVSSGEDILYQHVRDERGVVIISQHVGLREQLRLLREMLERRPAADFPVDSQAAADWCNGYREWAAAAELLLKVGAHEVAAEAAAIEALIQSVAALRLTTDGAAEGEEESAWRQRQMMAAGQLFAWHDRLTFARRQLTLADYKAVEGYGTCAACGCTDAKACEGGCGWSDEAHTLCTRCADSAPAPRLVPAGGAS